MVLACSYTSWVSFCQGSYCPDKLCFKVCGWGAAGYNLGLKCQRCNSQQAALLLLKHCIQFLWRGVVTLLLPFLHPLPLPPPLYFPSSFSLFLFSSLPPSLSFPFFPPSFLHSLLSLSLSLLPTFGMSVSARSLALLRKMLGERGGCAGT